MTAALQLVESVATRRAGLLTRVSGDDSGRERSPEEQEKDGRRDCERNGLDVVAVYRDVVPASRYSNRTRPDYERAKRDVLDGNIDVLWAWSVDRTTRRVPEFEALADLCREAGVAFLVNGRLYDVEDGEDLFQLRLASILGAREVDVLRKRVMRALKANAEAGRPHGRLQWGYTRTYDERGNFVAQTADPVTGKAVREAFKRFAKGETLRAIVRDFERRDIPSPSPDGQWRASSWITLRELLKRRSYLGHREHNGEVVVENAWPALVDPDTFDRVQHLLRDPRRRKQTGTATKHLLSGLLACGSCGGSVTFKPRTDGGDLYRCKERGCVGRIAAPVDDAVTRLVIARLSEPDALNVLAGGAHDGLGDAIRELSELTARLSDAEDEMAAGTLSAGAFGRLEAKLAPRIAGLRSTVAELSRPVPAELQRMASGGDVAKRWARATVDERRAVIRALLTLRLQPVGRGVRGQLGIGYTWVNGGEELVL